MATIRLFPLHENLLGGVDSTTPAHLLKPDQWRAQHNFRLVPTLKQVPHKVVKSVILPNTPEDVRWIGIVPSGTPGHGDAIALTPSRLLRLALSAGAITGAQVTGLTTDSTYRRWSTALYNGSLYFVNELNTLRSYQDGVVTVLANAPTGRYLLFWYDHILIGAPNGKINSFQLSDLYDFTGWTPASSNESITYQLVEWQQTDYPFTGLTGMGKLRGTVWIYTPTAIIPIEYVGLPKVIQVRDSGIITRTGNTFPWTLVVLDTVHFFYDALESMFFVFDGQQVIEVGEPVRQFLKDNLNEDLELAQKMYGYVDTDYREIWWPFVSKDSVGPFDKAVVFNYRYKKWFTASVEDVQAFCSGIRTTSPIYDADDTSLIYVANDTTTIGDSGLNSETINRVFGSGAGNLLREEETVDTANDFANPYDDPVLETPDFHYGDIRCVKENDLMILNTTAPSVEIRVAGRNFLGAIPEYPTAPNRVWTPTLPDAMADYPAVPGRVMRYKFTFKDSRLVTFDAFSEGVTAKKAEK